MLTKKEITVKLDEKNNTVIENGCKSRSFSSTINDVPSILNGNLKNNVLGDADESELNFINEKIKITNKENLDILKLLSDLQRRYTRETEKWKNLSIRLRITNLILTCFVILLQITQGIVFQLNDAIISPATKSSFGTVIPILVSGIAAIQLKFGWAKKSDKAKKCASMYSKMLKEVNYRLVLAQSGAFIEDLDKICNEFLLLETENVPAYINAY